MQCQFVLAQSNNGSFFKAKVTVVTIPLNLLKLCHYAHKDKFQKGLGDGFLM